MPRRVSQSAGLPDPAHAYMAAAALANSPEGINAIRQGVTYEQAVNQNSGGASPYIGGGGASPYIGGGGASPYIGGGGFNSPYLGSRGLTTKAAQQMAVLQALAGAQNNVGNPEMVENPFADPNSGAQPLNPQNPTGAPLTIEVGPEQYYGQGGDTNRQQFVRSVQQTNLLEQTAKAEATDRGRIAKYFAETNGLTEQQKQEIWQQHQQTYAQRGVAVTTPPPPVLASFAAQQEDPLIRASKQHDGLKVVFGDAWDDSMSAFLDPKASMKDNAATVKSLMDAKSNLHKASAASTKDSHALYSAQRSTLKDLHSAVAAGDYPAARSLYETFQQEFGGPPPLEQKTENGYLYGSTTTPPTFEDWAKAVTNRPVAPKSAEHTAASLELPKISSEDELLKKAQDPTFAGKEVILWDGTRRKIRALTPVK